MPGDIIHATDGGDPSAKQAGSRAPQPMEITMSYSIFQSARSRRNGTFHNLEAGLEEQIEALREELTELTRLVGKSSRSQGEKIRTQANAGYDELLGRSEDLLRELQDRYQRG